jgi:hypothetical protein
MTSPAKPSFSLRPSRRKLSILVLDADRHGDRFGDCLPGELVLIRPRVQGSDVKGEVM